MRIVVDFTNDAHTRARITVVPGWLGSLFGARARSGDAEQVISCGYCDWVWSTTKRKVGLAATRALELQEVVQLPAAHASVGK